MVPDVDRRPEIRAVSKVGQRLTKRQAQELLPVVQTTVADPVVIPTLSKLSFIFRKQTIKTSIFGWWFKAIERHRQYHRGKDEGEVREIEHRVLSAERPIKGEPRPTISELELIKDDCAERGEHRRAMNITMMQNKLRANEPVVFSSELVVMIRLFRKED